MNEITCEPSSVIFHIGDMNSINHLLFGENHADIFRFSPVFNENQITNAARTRGRLMESFVHGRLCQMAVQS